MKGIHRRIGLSAAVSTIVAVLAIGLYAQDQFEIYLFVLDKEGVPALDIKASDILIEEDAGRATVSRISRYGWPLKLTVLVDNGPGTADALIHLRNGLTRLVDGLPRDIPVSLIATAPNPRWLIRESKDLVQIRNAIGRLTPDDGYGRFSEALGEYADRLDQEFRQVEGPLPPYLPVLVSIATTGVDASQVLRDRNRNMLLSLRKHQVWAHMIMISPSRRLNEPDDVSNLDVDEGQNAEIAHLVRDVTGGTYIPISSGGTTALPTNVLPSLAQSIALRYLKQVTQHRIEFERAPGASGPMRNFSLKLLNHPGASIILSTDGNMR